MSEGGRMDEGKELVASEVTSFAWAAESYVRYGVEWPVSGDATTLERGKHE